MYLRAFLEPCNQHATMKLSAKLKKKDSVDPI